MLKAAWLTVLTVAGTVDPVAGQIAWSAFSPAGEGFSVDAPGPADPSSKPGYYVFNADQWAFFIRVAPVSDAVSEFVKASDRRPIRQYLESIYGGMIKDKTQRSRSDADFAGYPSIRFDADGVSDRKETFQGKYWLLVTEQHHYTILLVGPAGTPTVHADRFLSSFKLLKGRGPMTSGAAKRPLANLTAAMVSVAALTVEEQLRGRLDEFIQNTPSAQRLGTRWTRELSAWQEAHASVTKRIAAIANLYGTSGEMDRTVDAAVTRLEIGPQVQVLATALEGPAGAAIVADNALIEFLASVMASDPNGPKVGDRAWQERTGVLVKKFDERLGSILPRDRSRESEFAKFLSTPTGDVFRRLWTSVLGKATSDITGAVNLMMFDDRAAIMREIEAIVARVK